MASEILFTDDDGPVTLLNGFDPPGDRFRGWVPLVQPIGPVHNALGTGIPYLWEHRCDYGASFELPYIPNESQTDAVRLIRHLMRAGQITVHTGDADGASYDCYLWPGSTPKLSPPDPRDLRRILSLSVLNATADEIMSCVWP